MANQQWQVAIAHILSLADGDAVDLIFFQSVSTGTTPIISSCYKSAPLELVQLMITEAKLDSRKRCLLAITNSSGINALYYAAWKHSDPAVLELLIRENPLFFNSVSIEARMGGCGRSRV